MAAELKEKSGWWIVCKYFLITLIAIISIGIGYVVYCFVAYYRLPDNLDLEIHPKKTEENVQEHLSVNEVYSIATYNIGFGAYTPEYSFFMDGGTESWAFSKKSCEATVLGAINTLKEQDLDFMLVQEIDFDSTRSYHIDQRKMIADVFPEYDWVFAQNYDSPFLIYPFTQPHGASKAGIGTYSKYPITSAVRRSLPIANSLSKFLDLDRCYSVTVVPIENGKRLQIFNLHISAYGSDGSIRERQIAMLLEDMDKAYEQGDYVICGGDYNHDLSLAENEEPGNFWACPFPRSELPEYLSFAFDGMTEAEKDALGNSARNNDIAYQKGVTDEFLLDGFLISDNVRMISYEIVHDGFAFSDHEPVVMRFELME